MRDLVGNQLKKLLDMISSAGRQVVCSPEELNVIDSGLWTLGPHENKGVCFLICFQD